MLDAVAARTPAPGGGTAAAWATALAASLVEMAANFSDGADASFERAGRLRTRALELAEVELHAYEPVLEALRLPRDDPERAARVDAAQTEASRSPLEITRIGAELTELAGELAHTGNPNLSGDALAAALLAEAAAQAAARLVAINLTEGPAVEESSQLAQRALAARERALG
ncbi:MAG: cyclodeaminase/cyclohydrolase family protein [Solirubrobacteraceae bacterium]